VVPLRRRTAVSTHNKSNAAADSAEHLGGIAAFWPSVRRIGALQRVLPFTKGNTHPPKLDLQLSILKERSRFVCEVGVSREIALLVSSRQESYKLTTHTI
jgi:hypothetical protein